MGVEMNAQNEIKSPYVDAVQKVSHIFYNRIYSLLQMFPFYHELSKQGTEERKNIKILHQFTNDVILRRREKLLAEEEKKKRNDNFIAKKKLSLLDMLLSVSVDGVPLSNEDIREEVDTFMFAASIDYFYFFI